MLLCMIEVAVSFIESMKNGGIMTKRITALIVLLSFLLVASASAFAQYKGKIEILNLTFIGCGSGSAEGSYSALVLRDNGFPENQTTPLNITATFTTNNGVSSFTNLLTSNDVISFGINAAPQPISFLIIRLTLTDNPLVRSSAYYMDCATGQIIQLGDTRDDRINYGAGDLLAALYMSGDGLGNPVVKVYAINEDSEGEYIGRFNAALFEPYIDNAPEANLLIERIGKVSLYALSSGEFQFNIGPDDEGKYARVLFTNFPPRGLRLFPAAR